MTKFPISKLNELAQFHQMPRHEYLAALIQREHANPLLRIEQAQRPDIFERTHIMNKK